jgi:hypothetical protein
MIQVATIRIILGAEVLALRHRLLQRGLVRLGLIAMLVLAAAVFIGGGAFTVGAAAGAFLPDAVDPLLVGGFTGLSVLMLVVGFPSVIATFFVGRDLLQLVLAPIRTIEIFAARLTLAMLANLLISCILVAVVFGIGAGAGAPPSYYVLALLLIFVQVLVITSLQIALMSLVLRWVPARLARDVAAAVAGLTGAGLYLAWNLSLRQSFSGRSRPDFVNLTALIQRVDWLPPAWPGHALSTLIAGNGASAVFWVGLTVVLSASTLAVAAMLYERTLAAGLGIFGSPQARWIRKARQAAPVNEQARGKSSPAFAIARKDWLGFRRDVRRLSRLLPALLFPIGYVFAFSRPSRGMDGFWAEVFLVGFMSMFMSSTLATPSIPGERRGFQLLRMAPVTMWQVLRAKVLLTLPPVIAITIAFSIVVSLVSSNGIDRILELSLLVIWLGSGFVAIGVSAGGIDPRFDALDDRRAVGLVGTLAGVGGSLGFALLSIGALALFIFGTEAIGGIVRLGPIELTPAIGAVMWVVGVVLAASALAVVGVLLWLANARLRRFEGAIANA